MKEPKPIVLDGRTGEGGGQLVRLAVCLSAVSTQPIRITHVRGNRSGGRGGGKGPSLTSHPFFRIPLPAYSNQPKPQA